MTQSILYTIWARSEQQAAGLQRQGWVCDPDQPITHHSHYSILLRWDREGEPPPESEAV